MLTKHEGFLVCLVMPGQKQILELSSGITSSPVHSPDKEGEDMGPVSYDDKL